MDAFLRRVVEQREREQLAVEYLREQEEEVAESPTPRFTDGLGPKITMYEDWLCRWCGAMNRRRISAEREPSCAACRKMMKPCADCGGPVGVIDAEPARPRDVCKECWKLDTPGMMRQMMKAAEKLKAKLALGVKQAHKQGRPPRVARRNKVMPKPAKRRVFIPQHTPQSRPQTKPPRQPTGSVRTHHGSWQARWVEKRKLRSRSFRTRAEAQRFLRSRLRPVGERLSVNRARRRKT